MINHEIFVVQSHIFIMIWAPEWAWQCVMRPWALGIPWDGASWCAMVVPSIEISESPLKIQNVHMIDIFHLIFHIEFQEWSKSPVVIWWFVSVHRIFQCHARSCPATMEVGCRWTKRELGMGKTMAEILRVKKSGSIAIASWCIMEPWVGTIGPEVDQLCRWLNVWILRKTRGKETQRVEDEMRRAGWENFRTSSGMPWIKIDLTPPKLGSNKNPNTKGKNHFPMTPRKKVLFGASFGADILVGPRWSKKLTV